MVQSVLVCGGQDGESHSDSCVADNLWLRELRPRKRGKGRGGRAFQGHDRQREVRVRGRATRCTSEARKYSGCKLARLFRECVAKARRHDGNGERRQSADWPVLY